MTIRDNILSTDFIVKFILIVVCIKGRPRIKDNQFLRRYLNAFCIRSAPRKSQLNLIVSLRCPLLRIGVYDFHYCFKRF